MIWFISGVLLMNNWINFTSVPPFIQLSNSNLVLCHIRKATYVPKYTNMKHIANCTYLWYIVSQMSSWYLFFFNTTLICLIMLPEFLAPNKVRYESMIRISTAARSCTLFYCSFYSRYFFAMCCSGVWSFGKMDELDLRSLMNMITFTRSFDDQ